MKVRETYRITAVRLVEFHNLGTTTVDLPAGGHLFLLGDNGSGKTTLLDAIHLVLSGGREMEFNSAARVAGAKDSGGRTIQGIVLRYNAVTGRTARETGLTYAAVEFKSDADKTLSLVVGLSAEGLDVAYQSWGGIAAVAVRDLPLTVEENGRLRAATQAEFKQRMAAVTGGRYFVHISDYREAVGNRLFGGETKYADVCKLLRTGKAYREIAARAANYDDLFRQLLEDPPRETFEPLLKGLRELEESKGRLDLIDARGCYLQHLKGLRDKLATLRLKTSIVAWAEAEDARRRADEAATGLATSVAAGAEEVKALEGDWNLARAETEQVRERYDALRQKDASGFLGREKAIAARFAEAERRVDAEVKRLAEEMTSAQKAVKALQGAEKVRSDALGRISETLRKCAHAAGVPIGALTDALAVAGRPPYHVGTEEIHTYETFFAATQAETAAAQERAVKKALSLRASAEDAATAVEEAKRVCDELAQRDEAIPEVPGFAEAKAALKADMLSARPLYELLEPASGCDARHLAWLEQFVGETFLATFVTDEKDADRVRRLVWRTAEAGSMPQHTVAVREDCAGTDVAALTPWLGSYLSFEDSDAAALQLLARHLAASAAPRDGEFLEAKVWSFRSREGLLTAARPRLIGVKAREQEQARLRREAEARRTACERELKRLEKSAAEAEATQECVRKFGAEVEAARTEIWRTDEAVRAARAAADAAEASAARTRQLAEERKREAEALCEELEDIRLQMRSAGVDATLERRLASAERQVRAKSAEADELLRKIGAARTRLEELEKAKAARAAEAADAATRAAELGRGFAALKSEGESDESFAVRMCPELGGGHGVTALPDGVVGGDHRAPRHQFSDLREQFVGDARVCETEIARLVREPQGEMFAFAFDAAKNELRDRRNTSIDDVLADELRELEKFRTAINEKSREVFERIFMGEVMRRLYIDLKQVEDLVGRIQRRLSGRRFGSNRYAFALVSVPEYEGFVNLVRKGYLLESGAEKDELRGYLEAHRDEILSSEIDTVPEIFDYRRWFRFQLKVLTENEEGRVIDRRVKSLGSGGEQAVPNYLLILTVAEFLYHGGEAVDPPKAAPLLFDEAFYGIDAARRDQLLAFADDLGLQLFVSSPDQDGVKREIRHSVSLIVVKDENLDVHLSPIVWTNVATQSDLFGAGGDAEPGMKVLEETR